MRKKLGASYSHLGAQPRDSCDDMMDRISGFQRHLGKMVRKWSQQVRTLEEEKGS